MAINVNANILLQASTFLDARQSFDTIADMKDFAESSIPDGLITYNKETKKYYSFDSSNTEDGATGKWREYNGSTTSTSYPNWTDGIDYKVGDIVLKDNIKRQCIVEHTSNDFDVEKDNWIYVFDQYYYVSQAQYNQMITNGIITDETKDLYIIDGNTNGNDNENAGIEIYEDYSQFPMDFEFDCVVYAKNEHLDNGVTYNNGLYFANATTGTYTRLSTTNEGGASSEEEIPIIENGKDIVYHKITKNRSVTELELSTDRNGYTCYKIDDLYLTYDCEKLAKGFDDWFAEKSITPVKGTTYEDVAQIKAYNPSAGGYVYLSTHIKFDNTTYLGYYIKYNDTDYTIINVQYDHTNGKTHTTFNGLNVFNIAKIIPELAGYYIQSDILDVLHNWFELYKPIGLKDAIGLYSKAEALLNQDLTVNTSIDSKKVGAFDLGNIVSLMTSPLQRLLFTVDSEGANLKAYANDESKRTSSLTNSLFGSNLLASKNIFATLNDMSTLPTPPDGALGIWTVVPDAPSQPESTNKGGTLIIAHITSELYSQTVSYIGTRIAIYVTQGAIYYALGYGGKYYPTASWTSPSGGSFRWYKISSTLI